MSTSQRRVPTWIAASLPLVVLACAAGLGFTPLRLLPQNGLAEARWRAQGIRHYRLTATLSQGWLLSEPWTVEIRDEQVIAGTHTLNGTPLKAMELRVAQDRMPVSKIFRSIEDDLRRPALNSPHDLPTLLARLAPPLRRQLDRCAARMPAVAYDPTLGYPRGVTVYASPCFPNGGWTVLVTNVTPLP